MNVGQLYSQATNSSGGPLGQALLNWAMTNVIAPLHVVFILMVIAGIIAVPIHWLYGHLVGATSQEGAQRIQAGHRGLRLVITGLLIVGLSGVLLNMFFPAH